MSEAARLLEQASQAGALGQADEALQLCQRAVAAARSNRAKFEALLARARAEVAVGQQQAALDTYWEARRLTKANRLGRTGEADLGIGMMMLDLGRPGEGLEAVRRAVRYFRKAGNTFLRGCAETVLADEAIKAGTLDAAERHLEVASDLLEAAAEPRMLSGVLTLRAEVLAMQGRGDAALVLLARAEHVAHEVIDAAIRLELESRRRDVRELLATAAASPSKS